MIFEKPLLKAKLVARYKRFFADAVLENGETVTAHCPNTGSMKGLLTEGNTVWLSQSDDPKRKLKYTLEMIDVGTSLVGVHTGRPNHLVAEAILAHKIQSLNDIAQLRHEVKYGHQNSRIDLLLEQTNGTLAYIEVKNTTLREGEAALFPDAVTSRGAKHLEELMAMVNEGHRGVIFFLAQRTDCTVFHVAEAIDPHYAETLRRAVSMGVEALCYQCHITPTEIYLDKELEVVL